MGRDEKAPCFNGGSLLIVVVKVVADVINNVKSTGKLKSIMN